MTTRILLFVFLVLGLVIAGAYSQQGEQPPLNDPQIDRQNWIDGSAKEVADSPYLVNGNGTEMTTNFGCKVNDSYSETAGFRQPTLLEDFIYREKMTHFDHERIPERVVHARGVAVHGVFQSYGNYSNLTRARFLQDTEVKTPVFVRFSTVAGSRGSADSVRDVRGFAVRFFTEEGNFDLVGNNIPVFFIQDAIKFPDLIHAVKPEPQLEIPQAQSAHDTAWDFFSLHKETTHMALWVMSDRAIPKSLRQMQGFGVHTFLLVNSTGDAVFIKWHWKPLDGMSVLVWDEAQKLAGKDPDFHRKDLYEAIQNGNYPQFELGIQVIPLDQEMSFPYDILDDTKLIPEETIPVFPVGVMTLNRLPTNYFSETEQVTFHLGHVVPGIDFSNDPMLQGRLFSYVDTQINRHGSANYMQLPINKPLVPVNNNYRDGVMQPNLYQGDSSYYPNSVGGNHPRPVSPEQGGFKSYPQQVEGYKIRSRSPSFVDYYSQAQLFYNSLTPIEQQHLVDAMRFELAKVKRVEIRQRWVESLENVDFHLARRVAAFIGVTVPTVPKVVNNNQSSPALSIELMPKVSNKNKKIAILAGPGVEASIITQFQTYFQGEGVACDIVAPFIGDLGGVTSTQTLATAASVLYDAVFVPGGSASVAALEAPSSNYPPFAATQFVQEAYSHSKPIGAVGDGSTLLSDAQVPTADTAAALGVILSDDGSSDFDAFLSDFSAALLTARFWDRVTLDQPDF